MWRISVLVGAVELLSQVGLEHYAGRNCCSSGPQEAGVIISQEQVLGADPILLLSHFQSSPLPSPLLCC